MSSRAGIDKHDAKIDASCTKFIAMISNIIVCYIIYLCNVCHTYYISKKNIAIMDETFMIELTTPPGSLRD